MVPSERAPIDPAAASGRHRAPDAEAQTAFIPRVTDAVPNGVPGGPLSPPDRTAAPRSGPAPTSGNQASGPSFDFFAAARTAPTPPPPPPVVVRPVEGPGTAPAAPAAVTPPASSSPPERPLPLDPSAT